MRCLDFVRLHAIWIQSGEKLNVKTSQLDWIKISDIAF